MCMWTSGMAQQEQLYSETVGTEDQGPVHYWPKGYFRWAPGTDWRCISSCSTSGMVLKHTFQFRFTWTELTLCALSPLCMVSRRVCNKVTQKVQTRSVLGYQRYHACAAFTEPFVSALRLAPLGRCYTKAKDFMDLQAKHRLLTQKQQKPWKLTTKAYLICENCWKRKVSEGMFSLAAKKHIS